MFMEDIGKNIMAYFFGPLCISAYVIQSASLVAAVRKRSHGLRLRWRPLITWAGLITVKTYDGTGDAMASQMTSNVPKSLIK